MKSITLILVSMFIFSGCDNIFDPGLGTGGKGDPIYHYCRIIEVRTENGDPCISAMTRIYYLACTYLDSSLSSNKIFRVFVTYITLNSNEFVHHCYREQPPFFQAPGRSDSPGLAALFYCKLSSNSCALFASIPSGSSDINCPQYSLAVSNSPIV